MSRGAVFFDRDGTLVVEGDGYLTEVDDLHLIDGAAEAVAVVNASSFAAVLVTNQSAIARGLLTADGLDAIHERLRDLLSSAGGHLDAIYYCPHKDACLCRKPAPGMLTQAAADLDLNLSASYLVGDDVRDLAAAVSAGVTPVLVLTGKGQDQATQEAAYVARDVAAAVDWIMKR